MFNLIVGRAGSGKTEYVRKILGDKAKAGNEKLLYIVPEQFSYTCERALLLEHGPQVANRIEVLSFTRLVDYVNRAIGGLPTSYADDKAKLILMLKTLHELDGELEFYKHHTNSTSLAQQLLYLTTEFYMQQVTPDMLDAAAEKIQIKEKILELSKIYRNYDSILRERFTNDNTILDELASLTRETNFFEGYTVVIDAFKGFTAQELQIIEIIIKQANDVFLTLCLDPTDKDLDTSMIFESVEDTKARLERIETPNIIKMSSSLRFKNDDLLHLEKNIFEAEVTPLTEYPKNIKLCTADNKRAECNFIAATIRKLIRTEDLKLSDIAIIVRDETEYNRELVSAFNRYDIPVYEDVRQPITNQPVIALIRSVLRILVNGFTTENILNYLKTGLSPISLDDISELENYALIWNIKGDIWRKGFLKENSPLGLKEPRNEKEAEAAEEAFLNLEDLRKQVITPLLKLEREFKDDTNAFKAANSLYNFLIETGTPSRLKDFAKSLSDNDFAALAEEQDRVWDILMDILDKIATVYGENRIKPKTFLELFDAVVSISTLGSIPHGLDEVIIGSADRIRPDSPKVVFVAGCAEGIFPRTISSSGLLSNAERRLLEESANISLSPPVDKQAAEERFIAYTALSAASEKVYISYPRDDKKPSIIYNAVKNLYADKMPEIILSEQECDYLAETEYSTFLSYAESIPKASNENQEKINALREIASKKYGDKVEAIDQIIENRPKQIQSAKIAERLFGKNIGLSASRTETFYKCKFKYFCQYGLGAYPREKAEITPAISGTVIHYVLENIIKEKGKENLIKSSRDEREEAVGRWLGEYMNVFFKGTEGKTARFLYLYNRLKVHLLDIVDRLCEEFSLTDFEPCDFELPLSDKEGIKPYHIDLGDEGGSIDIYGSVDRVDKYEKDGVTYIRVIDYKSGGKEFKLSEILHGLNMQMLIYLFAIEENGKDYYGGNIESTGILYYPALRATIAANRKDQDILAEKRKKDKESGMIRGDDFILEAMEHGQQGIFIPMNEDSVVSLAGLGKIKETVEEEIRQLGLELHKGNIEVQPIYKSSYDNACAFCDYHAICGFEQGDPITEIKNKKNKEILEELSNG